jgi:hypothetical protein
MPAADSRIRGAKESGHLIRRVLPPRPGRGTALDPGHAHVVSAIEQASGCALQLSGGRGGENLARGQPPRQDSVHSARLLGDRPRHALIDLSLPPRPGRARRRPQVIEIEHGQLIAPG